MKAYNKRVTVTLFILVLLTSCVTACNTNNYNQSTDLMSTSAPSSAPDSSSLVIASPTPPIEEYEQHYKVIDRYGVDDNPSYSDLFDSENSLERLKSLNSELNSTFDFFELHIQSLEYIGYYAGDEKFVNGKERINQRVEDIEGNEMIITPLKTVMLGEAYYSYFDDCIENGRNFIADDFSVNSADEEINIILGYEYMDTYNIGDTLHLSLHLKDLTYKVIGFYKQNTFIEYLDSEIIFDQAIIMPFYNINYSPADEFNEKYQEIYYTQKNEGFIRIPKQDEEINENVFNGYLEKIEILSEKYDLVYSLAYSPMHIC